MIKNFLKIIISILILLLLFIFYLSYFGIETKRFNSIIKENINKQNNELDIDLNEVKVHLDIKKLSIKIKTQNPKLILKKYNNIELDEISSNISISSYFQNKFAIKNLIIKSKNNKINDYVNFFRLKNNSLQFILLNQFLKNGTAQINAELNFDNFGKIKKNYKLRGKVLNAELDFHKYKNVKELNFDFNISDKNYKLDKIVFKFNEIKFNSKFLNINQKNDNFFIKGDLKNKEDKVNNETFLLFLNNSLDNFDFSDSIFDSESEFTFEINKKFKIKNLKINSKLSIDKLIFKYDFNKIKTYFKDYDNLVKLKENKIQINYSEKRILIDGSSEFYIEKNFKNLLSFKIEKNKNKTNFETFLNLNNIDLKIDGISYKKTKEKNATLQIKGFKNKKRIFFKNINFIEDNNKIEISNLELNNNKILNIDEIRFDYLTNNNFRNEITLTKKNVNYELLGKSFDAIQFIENISNSEPSKNYFERFKNLNSMIKININKIKLDDENTINHLNGNLEVRSSKIFDLNLNSNFNSNEKIFISIKTNKDNSVITTLHSDRAKPFVKKYKFIKGFEDGNLDFSSTKINNVSKSKLIIDNFKVKEIPVLAKILSLASLQGIADLLTGEGVRFTDFEMIYSNKGSLTTIDEMYAIGPAISIMMEGYVERKKIVSLRGTLVPATTINRTISSIPLLGDLLVGKKVGEGVFGVSFKIKGPPENLETKVNPIKTLAPRFITRTLEKIKKN